MAAHRPVVGAGDALRFTTRVNRPRGHHPGEHATHRSVATLTGPEFVDRLMQHVVPSGFERIRHCGLMAPAAKAQLMASARALLAMPAANPAVTEEVRAFMQRVAGIDR